jgi:hypothetical protein
LPSRCSRRRRSTGTSSPSCWPTSRPSPALPRRPAPCESSRPTEQRHR